MGSLGLHSGNPEIQLAWKLLKILMVQYAWKDVMRKKKTKVNLELIDLYSTLLQEVWGKVSELIGESLLAFLVQLTIDRMPENFSILGGVRVSEGGISLEAIRDQSKDTSPEDIHRAFQGFVKNLFNVFTAITADVINRELFSTVLAKLREAEKMISR